MAVVRWLRPPPYKRLSLANKRAFSIIAEIPIAGLEMKRRISVREREDCTLVAWYGYLGAPRAGGAYESHHLVALGGAAAAWPLGARTATRSGADGRKRCVGPNAHRRIQDESFIRWAGPMERLQRQFGLMSASLTIFCHTPS